MNVLIVGGGKIGSHLARVLSNGGASVTLVEEDANRVQILGDEMRAAGVRLVHGDGDEPSVLEDAGVRNADAIVAATGHDEDNLVVTLLGKQEYHVPLTIARTNNPRNEWLFNERFGVDSSVSGTASIVERLGCCVENQGAE